MKVLVSSLLFVYVSVGAYLYFAQRDFIYFPTLEVNHPYNEDSYRFKDATVRVVVLNEGKQNAILYFGGNGEAVEYNAPQFIDLFPNNTIYLVKYRGYGGSTGDPSEDKIYSDALSIFDTLKQKHSAVSIIGRSLGSGVATLIAAKRDIDRLVLITPYDSIKAIVQKAFPIFPMSILWKDRYDSIGRAGSIKVDTLLLVAEDDEVIKRSHSDNLAKALDAATVSMVVIKNSGHNSISNAPEYSELLAEFIAK